MNRYSRWKYILILASIVLGLLYSVPNWFGQVPAVQVSPAKAVVQITPSLETGISTSVNSAPKFGESATAS